MGHRATPVAPDQPTDVVLSGDYTAGQCPVLACLRGGMVSPFPVPFSSDTVVLTVQSNDLPGYGGDRSSSPVS
jgi:hypothetical protein